MQMAGSALHAQLLLRRLGKNGSTIRVNAGMLYRVGLCFGTVLSGMSWIDQLLATRYRRVGVAGKIQPHVVPLDGWETCNSPQGVRNP